MSRALEDIAAERQRQIEVEGWTPEHDDQHADGEMAMAASCYADHAANFSDDQRQRWPGATRSMPHRWPMSWATSWWKPKTCRADLVRAGALIIAEIERLDRAADRSTTTNRAA